MPRIISIATEVPAYCHTQQHLLQFMEGAYGAGEKERRILKYLYEHSGIDTRYSVIPDFTLPMDEWQFFPHTPGLEPFPGLEYRMQWYQRHALPLSLMAANNCIQGITDKTTLTHLITVSCTGMSAPGLELQLAEAMGLRADITRTAINFMGCYAAMHGLKMAADIVAAHPAAQVLVVCTELCSLHFQKTFTEDTITAPLLFGDGAAAVLVAGDDDAHTGLHLGSFYSEILKEEKDSMTWNISSTGFVMTLSADVPDVFRKGMGGMKDRALARAGLGSDAIDYWCIHPGGKRILQAIAQGLGLTDEDLADAYGILRNYGNMSSATILFVLSDIWQRCSTEKGARIFAAAFGPGLTMESVILSVV
jgi:predicted naringenin-chalcone synthase